MLLVSSIIENPTQIKIKNNDDLLIYVTVFGRWAQVGLDQCSSSVSLQFFLPFPIPYVRFIFRLALLMVTKQLPTANGSFLTSQEVVRVLCNYCDEVNECWVLIDVGWGNRAIPGAVNTRWMRLLQLA